jgi:hypothetical protein
VENRTAVPRSYSRSVATLPTELSQLFPTINILHLSRVLLLHNFSLLTVFILYIITRTAEIKVMQWDVFYDVICRIGQDPPVAPLLSIHAVDVQMDGQLECSDFPLF